MKKNYNYNDLSSKYELITEGASLALRKEMFKAECWDSNSDRPIPECWTESGEIKQECWSSGPGGTNSVDGGAIADSAQPTMEEPVMQEEEGMMEASKGNKFLLISLYDGFSEYIDYSEIKLYIQDINNFTKGATRVWTGEENMVVELPEPGSLVKNIS